MPTIARLQKKHRNDYKTENKQLAQAGYNAYRKLRTAYLMEHPLCEICLKNGIVKPTEEIHHITEILNGKTKEEVISLAVNPNNLIALCSDCHHKLHNSIIKL